jgi:hypothetical protein
MDIEIFGLAGLALIATSFARMAFERRLDVLYGPYLDRPSKQRVASNPRRRWRSVDTALDRLRSLETMRQDQLASRAC